MSPNRQAYIPVAAFVDWNSQLRAIPDSASKEPAERSRVALKRVAKNITKILCAESSSANFRVTVRVYSGWCKGFTRTVNHIALSSLPELHDLDALFPSGRVSVIPSIGYGDRLLDSLSKREHSKLGIHLPNTLRQQDGRSNPREKMVDTALASDLLSWVRSEPTGWAAVVSNDDDMVPPVFAAEAWAAEQGGHVMLIRSRVDTDRFLRLDGLVRSY